MIYLPDTNIIIALTRHGDRNVAKAFSRHQAVIGLSTVVIFELAYGAFNSGRAMFHLSTVEELPFARLDFNEEDARAAGEIRATLKRAGRPIGPYDVLIAGQALARGLTVVTHNTSEYERVAGLKVVDWTI